MSSSTARRFAPLTAIEFLHAAISALLRLPARPHRRWRWSLILPRRCFGGRWRTGRVMSLMRRRLTLRELRSWRPLIRQSGWSVRCWPVWCVAARRRAPRALSCLAQMAAYARRRRLVSKAMFGGDRNAVGSRAGPGGAAGGEGAEGGADDDGMAEAARGLQSLEQEDRDARRERDQQTAAAGVAQPQRALLRAWELLEVPPRRPALPCPAAARP